MIETLKKNVEFKRVYAKGNSLANYYLVLFFLKNDLGRNRVGFLASKKVGNSVVRNRARRLMKEGFRLYGSKMREGYDIILIARANIKNSAFKDVDRAMISILKKSKLLK